MARPAGSRPAATATGVGLAALAGDPGLEVEVAAVPASSGAAEGLGVPRTEPLAGCSSRD